MGAIVELYNDEKGIIWPESVAPFKIHLIALEGAQKEADELYEKIWHNGGEILYDDRDNKTAGEKFADADLIGCPVRLVVSEKTLKEKSVEAKRRNEKGAKLMLLDKLSADLL
jgi:prolyl-tRNA synthetase